MVLRNNELGDTKQVSLVEDKNNVNPDSNAKVIDAIKQQNIYVG